MKLTLSKQSTISSATTSATKRKNETNLSISCGREKSRTASASHNYRSIIATKNNEKSKLLNAKAFIDCDENQLFNFQLCRSISIFLT